MVADHVVRLARAAAALCALAAPARADLTPAVGAGTSVVVVTESAFGSRVSLAGALSGEVALPIRRTQWAVVPAVTLGMRVGTQPLIGTVAETIALARRVGPVSLRIGLGPMQMIIEDSGRARLVDRGVGAHAAVRYHPRNDLALVISFERAWLGEVSITSSTIGAAWLP